MASSFEAVIQTASIRTHNEMRDRDLRSSNFLDVDKYPTITFKSTKIEPAGQDRYTLTGDLTIKDQTRPVTLNVVCYGEFNEPMMGHRIACSAELAVGFLASVTVAGTHPKTGWQRSCGR